MDGRCSIKNSMTILLTLGSRGCNLKILATKRKEKSFLTLNKYKSYYKIDIDKTIAGLKGNSASEFDNIEVQKLNLTKPCLVRPITHILNISLTCGIFLNNYKHTIITPIHKTDCRKDSQKYRPISLLLKISKIGIM